MPRVYLTTEERIRAARQNNMRRKVQSLEQLLATVKHKVGYEPDDCRKGERLEFA